MSVVRRLLLITCVVLFAGTGCTRDGSEEGTAWIRTLMGEPRDPVDVESVAATGLRDGEITRARFVLEARSLGVLELDVEVRHVPQPVFVSGRWSERPVNESSALGSASGSAPAETNSRMSGSVLSADGLHFLGGQGGRPSLGGRFTLGRDRTAHYEVYVPPTILQPTGGGRGGRFGRGS